MALIAAEKSGIKFTKLIKNLNKLRSINGRLEKWNIKNKSQSNFRLRSYPRRIKDCFGKSKRSIS